MSVNLRIFFAVLALAGSFALATAQDRNGEGRALDIRINPNDGRYEVGIAGLGVYALQAGVAAKVNGAWLHSSQYPRHDVVRSTVNGYLGSATEWKVTYSGLSGKPNLIYQLRAYQNAPFADLQVTVNNESGTTVDVEAVRSLDATDGAIVDLGGPLKDDRILSDSYSEDKPAMKIRDLADAEEHMHLATNTQLIYNLRSRQSLFIGALTSDRFVTIMRLHLADSPQEPPRLSGYEVDSTGTTEMEERPGFCLEHASADDLIELKLSVKAGDELSSERILLGIGEDYFRQLETYAKLIQELHHARVLAPPLMGWWSWTAYYFGLNEGTALSNAEWEAQHLKSLGYNVFHVDEGYDYARGEYTSTDAINFPNGMAPLFYKVHGLGLLPGIYTVPFQASERSWVYQHHPDWLVKNAAGRPIQIEGFHSRDNVERLFVLDVTNPGAQEYLRKTYSTLVDKWGARYIKLDAMDDSGVEGYYYRPNTTAIEAQHIGLELIRETVGQDVYLDKDGGNMLPPVGSVDYGRIAQDTGHTFLATKEAATAIAARYYVNRHFYVGDPDAFTVSRQTVHDQADWLDSKEPSSLDEAQVSIALSAVSGGMLEIGDALPSLWNNPDRLALIENEDVINMVRLGQASEPIDLMTFPAQDGQPSLFFLKEDARQSILTIFDWTEQPRSHSITLAALGLAPSASYRVEDVLNKKDLSADLRAGNLLINQPRHSVRMLKIVAEQASAETPEIQIQSPTKGIAGESLTFAVEHQGGDPILSYRWDFGDGVQLDGLEVNHAYSQPGSYQVDLTATGSGGLNVKKTFLVHISGEMSGGFNFHAKRHSDVDLSCSNNFATQ
jgi:hypothetical protein